MSWSEFGGGGAFGTTESYMIFFVVLAIHAAIHAAESSEAYRFDRFLFLAGLALGMALTFKQIALFSILGVYSFLYALPLPGRGILWPRFRAAVVMGFGILLAVSVGILPLFFAGLTLEEYFNGVWWILSARGSRMWLLEGRWIRLVETWLQDRPRFLLFFLLPPMLLAFSHLRSLPLRGLLAWCFWEILGTHASGWLYAPHLRQLAPPFFLLAGISIAELLSQWEAMTLRRCVGPIADRSPFRTRTFVVLGGLTILWFPWVNVKLSVFYALRAHQVFREAGLWIREHSSPEDRVYVHGNAFSEVLYVSERRSPTRYINTLFTSFDIQRQEEQKNEVLAHRPRYIVLPERRPLVFPEKWIAELLEREYRRVMNFGYIMIYERRSEEEMRDRLDREIPSKSFGRLDEDRGRRRDRERKGGIDSPTLFSSPSPRGWYCWGQGERG